MLKYFNYNYNVKENTASNKTKEEETLDKLNNLVNELKIENMFKLIEELRTDWGHKKFM
jgi:hypothetical protein